MPLRSSRRQYTQYRIDLKNRPKDAAGGPHSPGSDGGGRGGGTGRDRRNTGPRARSFPTLLREFWSLLAGHRAILCAALGMLSVATLLGLVPLYGTKLVFDNVLDDKPLPGEIPQFIARHIPADQPRMLLAIIAVSMIALAISAMLVSNWSRWHATRIAKRVAVSTRRRAFEHAVRLPLHRVYEMKSGGVTSMLREDAGGTGELVFNMLYNPWRAIVQLAGSLLILALTDWRLLAGSLLILPTVWITHRTWIARIRPLWRDIRDTRRRVDAQTTESFGGMRIVRSFSRQRSEAAAFTANNHFMARQEILSWLWARSVEAAWSVLIPTASAILMWYGGNRILTDYARLDAGTITVDQALTTGDLVMFLGYLAALLGPIATLAGTATSLQNNLAGLDRTLDLLAEPLEMPDRPGAKRVTRAATAGHIRFENVSFAYQPTRAKRPPGVTPSSPDHASPGRAASSNGHSAPPHSAKPDTKPEAAPKQVLFDINLDVPAGQTVALVGPSGAGKTTLCNLVARFFDPTAGVISLDGVDLRDITVDSYRKLLGIVEQDTFLFDGTIADNIAYGRRHATRQDVIRAAQLANAHEFVSLLDHGYDTLIGERGVRLSGGQRQRLTIARAILADPRILILDEATSNLDTESERLIQSSLTTLMRNRTCFVIAHRLSTIRTAHRIVVIDQGRIAEQGTHDQLMAASGRYRHMVDLQTRPPDPVQLPELTEVK